MTAEEIEAWLTQHLALQLNVPEHTLDPLRRLEEYGLDSLEALRLTGELEIQLGRPVDPTILWDYPNIRVVSKFLAAQSRNGDAEPAKRASSNAGGQEA
jgi:8-amino-7-oxononanoate synthase